MPVHPAVLAFLLALALPAVAQPAGQLDSAGCTAQRAALEQDMAQARAKGQMLRRQQLGEALTALQARCDALAPAQDRAAQIDMLKQDIQALRRQLDDAEARLRRLNVEAP